MRNSRNSALTLKDFEDELAAVALVRALPMEYSSFRSALLLLTNFDFKTVKDAFLQEQKNRQPRAADSALALSSALKVSTPAKPSSQSVLDLYDPVTSLYLPFIILTFIYFSLTGS
ncbi:hypothetical protein EW145_g5395 [Phellinidium pouzarii]|uniref:Uncharacterized protein n=1 Tax=Phellinidium pouzarii TaxID=167371 RepID=A0A4S4L4W2_9AGAM|nr:hypothetical protein EW145_g5395 [Phellinidium pouzarii]